MTTHKFTNKEIVSILKEVLAAMEVKQANRFRIRAYQNAMGAIDNLTTTVFEMWENHRLEEIPGVGAGLKQHLEELFTTGNVKEFDQFKKDLPQGMFSLIGIRGIGAKKAFKLAFHFKLTDRATAVEKLKELAESHQIQVLEGFGEKSEKDILEAISESKQNKNVKTRMLLIHAEEVAERLITHMNKAKFVEDAMALGSLRRRNATVGDLDIAISSNEIEAVLEHFTKFPEVAEIVSKGEKKIQAVLNNDMQVDVRVSTPQAYGSMQQYFTGSKQHNVILRSHALEKGLSLSEYGIKKGERLHEFASEKAFYEFAGVDYIAPELRQGKNELELAIHHKLPKLIELKDIQGEIHTHTNASDGINTLEEMVSAAAAMGYKYFGISDHAPSVTNRGTDEVAKIIQNKKAEIRALQKKFPNMILLFGYEVNILADGTMAMPNELLKELDYAIGSIHTSFDQSREEVTKRVLNALENPYINVIGHPTGRLINQREGCDLDWRQIFECAYDNKKIIEINSQPNRLDLPDDLVKEAISKQINLLISTDSHEVSSLHLMRYGIDVARRGFAEAKNIINTLPTDEFLRLLGSRY